MYNVQILNLKNDNTIDFDILKKAAIYSNDQKFNNSNIQTFTYFYFIYYYLFQIFKYL